MIKAGLLGAGRIAGVHVEALNGDGQMPVTLNDGVAALAMAEAATRSAKSGQPVRLADV